MQYVEFNSTYLYKYKIQNYCLLKRTNFIWYTNFKDTIIRRGPGFVIAQSDVAETLIPYSGSLRRDGDINHGFKDLRGRPELVDEIPEAKKSKGLANLLRVIAHTASPFMSSTV